MNFAYVIAADPKHTQIFKSFLEWPPLPAMVRIFAVNKTNKPDPERNIVKRVYL